MKKSIIKFLAGITFASAFMLIASCGGSSSDDTTPPPVPDPVAAELSFPVNNEVCFDGTVISPSMSEVPFSWNPAENADKYELVVTNLETNVIQRYPAPTVDIAVSLERATPYSWYVKSLGNNTTAEATSETWKFYLAGEGVTNYAPFPAELLEPASGSTTNASGIIFTWNGDDPDSNVLTYELFADTTDGKTESLAANLSETRFETSLQPATTYYWSVVTTDQEGNTSRSSVYSFKTN
ncbi:fibronectin type III domain-containing protein [Robertkochia sediminum]|uniref:fibronectin type III domain-containing protein n=1 Tax=Robertkochia sediminum TaxID=2785326 RepID=UPI001931637F|nr:fibronectin type III domain-containing protein [Robertkochia sediminum]MBL7474017.1 fibronectin type III domain-containing protein [Robertkochia sediminum]